MASLFATKSMTAVRADAASGQALRRVLGPWDLTLLGIGAIIGTGIFVLSGHVAAHHAGPAVSLAFVLAGVAACLAALCYAEIASMVVASGSAYAYAYVSMGELAAWVIGWDLMAEYLLAAASVSVGWSAYVVAFVDHAFGVHLPGEWTRAPLAWDAGLGRLVSTGAYLNLPAAGVVLALMLMLIVGIKESARFNAATVAIKIAVILMFIVCAAPAVHVANWRPFVPDNAGSF
ncbi:MAG TPA: amino acid permease, partial [Myxococcota bacterium]|nr:amino acid permease [Myxococcota bacterium]